jgi:hypothetical protein
MHACRHAYTYLSALPVWLPSHPRPTAPPTPPPTHPGSRAAGTRSLTPCASTRASCSSARPSTCSWPTTRGPSTSQGWSASRRVSQSVSHGSCGSVGGGGAAAGGRWTAWGNHTHTHTCVRTHAHLTHLRAHTHRPGEAWRGPRAVLLGRLQPRSAGEAAHTRKHTQHITSFGDSTAKLYRVVL